MCIKVIFMIIYFNIVNFYKINGWCEIWIMKFFYDMMKFFFLVNGYFDKLRNFLFVYKVKKGIF